MRKAPPIFKAAPPILLLLCVLLSSAEASVYRLCPERSKLTFKGDSPLHGFVGTTSALEAGQLGVDLSSGTLLEPVEISVPVLSLATGNGARDHAVQYTLKEKTHPRLVLTAVSVSRTEGTTQSGSYRLEGVLTVAGVRRPVVAACRAVGEAGVLHVSGRLLLSLSMFDLQAPPLARMMRLRDSVEVEFDTVWAEAGAPA